MRPYVRKAQYHETDQMGIIHHANYIRWMEEARVDFMEQMGFGYDKMEQEGIISPVLSLSCDYKSMTRFGDEVTIDITIRRYTGIRLELDYEIRDKATGELRVAASSSHCFLSREGKPVSLKRADPACDALFRRVQEEDGRFSAPQNE